MLETAVRRGAGCPLASARLALAFDGSDASTHQMADVRQLFSPASGARLLWAGIAYFSAVASVCMCCTLTSRICHGMTPQRAGS